MTSLPEPGASAAVRPGREAVAAWAPPRFGGAHREAPVPARAGSGAAEAWIAPLLADPGPPLAETHLDHGPPESVEQAFARGYAEGLEQGAAQAREPLGEAVAALQGAAQAVLGDRGHYLRDLEANLSALAVLVAGKIVRREIAADPEIVHDLVAHALQMVKPDSPVVVRLHPGDLAGVQAALDSFTDAEAGTIRCAADENLERGSFFVEGPQRIVDGRLDRVLTALYERLAYD